MPQKQSQIVLLGTGTPNADPQRFGSSVAIIINDTTYIIDCGAGVVRRAAAACQSGVTALEVSKLNHLFLTHLHSDHTIGIPDLILTPWVLERKEPLLVYGPRGTRNMTDHILAAYNEDITTRLKGFEPANDRGYKVEVNEIEAGVIYKDINVKVEAFAVNHCSMIAYGYKLNTPDRVIAISGDTKPFDGLIDNYRGCDVLIHEVYSSSGFNNRHPEWQKYHSSAHTSSDELAKIANQVKPGLLILYHQLFHGVTEEHLLSEIKAKYNGKVVSGKDLDVY
ncbi:MBL fold metallo-hydrolase [bacterium]|nr:MBL fold metallo-hydrolase [bacterium]